MQTVDTSCSVSHAQLRTRNAARTHARTHAHTHTQTAPSSNHTVAQQAISETQDTKPGQRAQQEETPQ